MSNIDYTSGGHYCSGQLVSVFTSEKRKFSAIGKNIISYLPIQCVYVL